ncbi:MAG TPA: hypothetical protein VGM96_11050 [Reyranella sp.]|jgi:hypothetical protein
MTDTRPGADFLLNDIERANTYRLELIKLMLAMAGGLLAFTVSFRPSIAEPDRAWLIQVGWVALAISVIGGIFTLLMWEWFYISYRDFDNDNRRDEGKAYRKRITKRRRFFQFLQYAGLIAGVLGIGVFAALNIDKPPREPATKKAAIDSPIAPSRVVL